MKLIELLFSRSSVICLIWFLVFLFGGLRAQSAIGSAEKREQTKKPNETNEAEDKEVPTKRKTKRQGNHKGEASKIKMLSQEVGC